MPTYMLLSTLTPEGRQTLHKVGASQQGDRRLRLQGGRAVRGAWAVRFHHIVEAADNETVAHLSVDLVSRGTVNIVTLPAISVEDLRAKLKGPKQMGRARA